ncbi:MAG: F0F1 ATP synthase subunit delta [Akkermansiaceae bacterium]
MKVSKDAARTASRIYRLCAPEGRLDEGKLRDAVAKIVEAKPRDYRAILHALHRLARIDAESRQALVESATELDAANKSRIESSLNEQYGGGLEFTYKINADLLGGTRIRVGNDVWDGSVKSRLDRLANAF